jgi:hypothetical protein
MWIGSIAAVVTTNWSIRGETVNIVSVGGLSLLIQAGILLKNDGKALRARLKDVKVHG